MNERREEAYAEFATFCDELLPRTQALPDERSRQIVGEAVHWARANPEAIYLHSSGKLARYGHLPNMVAFSNLLDGLEQQSQAWDRPVRKIRHDRQMQFEKSLRYWHQMFANASADPLYLPGGERHILRKVFGSQFMMSSAQESAGIQAVDVVLWLLQRVLSADDLPAASARLMRFVFRKARQHDFSFAGVSARLEAMFEDLWTKPLSEAQLAKSAELLEQSERQRQERMIQYEEAKRLEALSPAGESAT